MGLQPPPEDPTIRAVTDVSQPLGTLPALFFAAADRWSGTELGRYYEDGVQIGISWDDAADEVRRLGTTLMRLGVSPGDRVAIISETSRHWTRCDMAILAVGAVTLGIYPTSKPTEIAFILGDAGAAIAIVETPAMARTLIEAQSDLPELERVLVILPDGEPLPSGLEVALVDSVVDVERADRADARRAFEARWQAVEPEALATLVYTSGTTGAPKGVKLTHRNLVHTAAVMARVIPMDTDDWSIVYLPLAHVLQRVSLYVGLLTGAHGVYAERLEELPKYIAEVRPTVLAGVPRVYEKIQARIMGRVAAAPPRRQKIFEWAVGVGREVSAARRAGRDVPLPLRLQHRVADRLVLRRIRDGLGGRVRFLGSGAAPIALDTLEFFHACGLLILEGYGLTETSAPVTLNTADDFRFGTVGRVIEGAELRIDSDGEVLCRGLNVTSGYWNRPEADEAAFTIDASGKRWFRTGDIGELDGDGYLRITDRKKDLLITAGGKNVAPQPIENQLRRHPLVEAACVIGDRQRYLSALLTLDPEQAAEWAAQNNLPGDLPTLVEHRTLRAALERHVANVNAELARYETVKRFVVLPNSFDVESGTLTPTMKLRRARIAEVHAAAIEGLYS